MLVLQSISCYMTFNIQRNAVMIIMIVIIMNDHFRHAKSQITVMTMRMQNIKVGSKSRATTDIRTRPFVLPSLLTWSVNAMLKG